MRIHVYLLAESRNFLRSVFFSMAAKDQSLSLADLKITDNNNEIALESYRQANQYARANYEGFYKHATISFAFNALLLTAFGFIFKDSAGTPQIASAGNLINTMTLGLASLGVVFNLGALVAFRTSWSAWYRIFYLIRMFEDANAENKILPVQKAIKKAANVLVLFTFSQCCFIFYGSLHGCTFLRNYSFQTLRVGR